MGANRGHSPLENVTYASVGSLCVIVIRVSLRLDSPSVGLLRVSVIRIHVSLRLDLPESAGEGNPEGLSALYMA